MRAELPDALSGASVIVQLMFLPLVLAIVGGVSLTASRAIQHGISNRQLARTGGGSPSTAKSALIQASLGLAIFLPSLLVAYVAIGLVRHALGQ
jgi:hypothetical protein